MDTCVYVFSDNTWWRDTLFAKLSLNGYGLMTNSKMKRKIFLGTWLKKKWMLSSNLKTTYISGIKNLIKPFFMVYKKISVIFFFVIGQRSQVSPELTGSKTNLVCGVLLSLFQENFTHDDNQIQILSLNR